MQGFANETEIAEMKTAFLAWHDPGHRWFPVGRLSREDNHYTFVYTRGALAAYEAGFRPLPSFPSFQNSYSAPGLFTAFTTRLLSQKRPEFSEFVSWLNLPVKSAQPWEVLVRSGGQRQTDAFEVFACPERDTEGRYSVQCFIRGLQHRTAEAIARAEQLQVGERLLVEAEPDNSADELAVKTLTMGDVQHIGYLPRYLAHDVHRLGLDRLDVAVEHVNLPPTPIQFRVLVRVAAPWPSGFRSFADPEFEPLPDVTPAP